ncbi:MAG: TonB-dependent receptor [Bacteroidota bacterium]
MNIKTTLFQVWLLSLLVLSTSLFAASNGSIKGTVRDVQSKDPLPFANVLLKGTGLGAAADVEGVYTIQNVPPGNYTLRVTFLGYQTKELKIEVKDGQTLKYDISLKGESVTGDTVFVTAQALGQRHAINEQLSSATIKNVVSSAKIQELPDVNAAESVSRLPGVSLIRTGGEGSKVVVRGLSPQYNRVTIDGVELPANATSTDRNDHKSEFDNNDELSLSGDRGADLSMISSNMLGGIEVIKAITPDMDATVFGGVVNFSMRKALKTELELPQFDFITQGNHNRLKSTSNDYKVVASYEQRFWENSFGLFAQGTVEKKNLSSNELNADFRFDGAINVASTNLPEYKGMSVSDILRDRRRYGGTLVFDYAYETGSVGFMNFYSRSNTSTINRNERVSELIDNKLFYSATNSDNILDVYSNLLSIKQDIGGFGVEVKLSHSYSQSESPDDVFFEFRQENVGLNNLYSALKYAPADKIFASVNHNPASAQFFQISNINNISKDRTYNSAVDVSKDFTISEFISSKIKIGGAYQYRSREYDYNQSSGSVLYDDGGQVSGAISRAFPQFTADSTGITFQDFIDADYSYGDFLKGDYILGPPMDVALMLDVIEVAKGHPGTNEAQGGYKPQILASQLYDYSGNEKRSAGYAMVTINFGDLFALMPGVRYQNLTTTYTGLRVMQTGPGQVSSEATVTQSHGYYLPMAHAQFKPVDWIQFHLAYTNTLNYADYNSIIPRYLISTNYVLYNNTELKPATSENYDAILSIYSNEVGLFTFGGFKKRIKDLVLPAKSYPTDFSEYPELYEKLKGATESRSLYTYINNPIAVDVIGIETEWQTNFWYLPGVFTGLVFNINYTHIFSEAKYPKSYFGFIPDTITFDPKEYTVDTLYVTRLLNQPNDVLNISFGYDYAGFSARISMLYKDNVFKSPQFWPQNRVNSDKYVRYDFSAKQELPWFGMQLFFNLNNISGEDDIDLNQKTSFITSQQRYGMTADLGLRLKF